MPDHHSPEGLPEKESFSFISVDLILLSGQPNLPDCVLDAILSGSAKPQTILVLDYLHISHWIRSRNLHH